MTKFNVGDRVRITDDDRWENIGKEGVIIEDDKTYCAPYLVRFDDGSKRWKSALFLELVNLDTSARLTEAEAEIATLKAKVDALETVLKKTLEIRSPSEVITVNTGKAARRSMQTPNRRRADVIKRAQAFVGDKQPKSNAFPQYEYIVNSEKRTVVALVRGIISGKVIAKGIAKCAPDDVFNADIGKAIALGRALGVDIPKEFTDAPKPSEVVVGMRVKGKHSNDVYKVRNFYKEAKLGGSFGRAFAAEGFVGSAWLGVEQVDIIEDTDAVYS